MPKKTSKKKTKKKTKKAAIRKKPSRKTFTVSEVRALLNYFDKKLDLLLEMMPVSNLKEMGLAQPSIKKERRKF